MATTGSRPCTRRSRSAWCGPAPRRRRPRAARCAAADGLDHPVGYEAGEMRAGDCRKSAAAALSDGRGAARSSAGVGSVRAARSGHVGSAGSCPIGRGRAQAGRKAADGWTGRARRPDRHADSPSARTRRTVAWARSRRQLRCASPQDTSLRQSGGHALERDRYRRSGGSRRPSTCRAEASAALRVVRGSGVVVATRCTRRLTRRAAAPRGAAPCSRPTVSSPVSTSTVGQSAAAPRASWACAGREHLQPDGGIHPRDVAGVQAQRDPPAELGLAQQLVDLLELGGLRPGRGHQRVLLLLHDARAEVGDGAMARARD